MLRNYSSLATFLSQTVKALIQSRMVSSESYTALSAYTCRPTYTPGVPPGNRT